MEIAELRLGLTHLAKEPGFTRFETYRHTSGIQVKNDFRLFGTLLLQVPGGAKCRMPGKWQLFLDSEDAHAYPLARFCLRIARKNESRLREIHLLCEPLHLSVAQGASVRYYGQLIAF